MPPQQGGLQGGLQEPVQLQVADQLARALRCAVLRCAEGSGTEASGWMTRHFFCCLHVFSHIILWHNTILALGNDASTSQQLAWNLGLSCAAAGRGWRCPSASIMHVRIKGTQWTGL